MTPGVKPMRVILLLMLLVCSTCVAAAETLTMGAGAGYKRMYTEIFKLYESQTGQRVEQVYGHMNQVLMQAAAVNTMGLVAGELSFLSSSDLTFSEFRELGQGKLVLAYSKQARLSRVEDLTSAGIQKVALADSKQAVYGKAAMDFLQNSGLYDKIRAKTITVPAVPQVSSYLISKDVDAGFINISDAIYIKDKIGGWVEIDPTQYSPVKLVIGVVEGFENKPEVKQFLSFITTDAQVKAILQKAGVNATD